MKVSYHWIKDYLQTDLSPEEMSVILTATGLEVEGIEPFESIKGGLKGLVIGQVLTCKKHENADKLSVTTVDIGVGRDLPIVCGAPNVAAGQKVIVATVGTMLHSGNESFEIKKAKIRGEVSEGMICAEDEIGVGNSHEGIMVLPDDTKIGTPASEYFKIETDTVFEIGLTPNRIDGASHFGVARDLAAQLSLKQPTQAQLPSVDCFKVDDESNKIEVIVENQEACPRYSGITISGIEIKESPEWLKNKLKAIGLNPINNIVDITNFVMHETGQPLHAFNADQIEGGKVIVKTLEEGTEFITLDEETRKLSSKDLMICNAKEGMCIAGVFGGAKSGIAESTQNIFLESAYFNPVWVRKTAKRHTLSTDSSFRFERGCDPENTIYALKRAVCLIKELAGGKVSSEIVDVYPEKVEKQEIILKWKNLDRLIGKVIDKEIVRNILHSLDFEAISEEEGSIKLLSPTYRVDVTREADVIEEILRIYGYNNIELSNKISSSLVAFPNPDPDKLQNLISDQLSGQGFNEIMCNSISKSDYYEKMEELPESKLVMLANPLSTDLNCMRQNLLFGGLESIRYNINHKNNNIAFYEFGNRYEIDKDNNSENPLKKYHETKQLALYLSGNKSEKNWSTEDQPSSFYQLKAYTTSVFERLGINRKSLSIEEISNDVMASGIKYSFKNKYLGQSGMVSKKVLDRFEISQEVFFTDINWTELLKMVNMDVKIKPISKYPEVKRDLALLIDKSIKFSEIQNLAYKTEKHLLKDVRLFDVFEDQKLGENKKSYAVNFTLLDEKKTLTDKQIDKVMKKLQMTFEKQLDASIR